MKIEVRKCTNPSCRRKHRLLPDISIPYKHYEASVIEDVSDGTIEEEMILENYPSESTIQRWKRWAEDFLRNAEGQIRSAAYRILDLSDEFLGTRESLLEALKERLNCGWLSVAIRIYINTG